MKAEQFPLRTVFLKNFVQELIKQKIAIQKQKETKIAKPKEEEFEEKKVIRPLPLPTQIKPFLAPSKSDKEQNKTAKEKGLSTIPLSAKEPKVIRFAHVLPMRPQMQKAPYMKQVSPPTPSIPNLPSPSPSSPPVLLESLNKVNAIMQDPFFQSIECTGPNKPVVVKKGNLVQTLPTTFTKEEIDSILEEVSQKTRIPLTKGVFTAAIGDKILNAVISDFVGSRFIIQKKDVSAIQ